MSLADMVPWPTSHPPHTQPPVAMRRHAPRRHRHVPQSHQRGCDVTSWMSSRTTSPISMGGPAREFWWFYLFAMLIYVGGAVLGVVLDAVVGTEGFAGVLPIVAGLASSSRSSASRYAGCTMSATRGSMLLVSLIPIVGGRFPGCSLLRDASRGPNEYGEIRRACLPRCHSPKRGWLRAARSNEVRGPEQASRSSVRHRRNPMKSALVSGAYRPRNAERTNSATLR